MELSNHSLPPSVHHTPYWHEKRTLDLSPSLWKSSFLIICKAISHYEQDKFFHHKKSQPSSSCKSHSPKREPRLVSLGPSPLFLGAVIHARRVGEPSVLTSQAASHDLCGTLGTGEIMRRLPGFRIPRHQNTGTRQRGRNSFPF